MIFPGLRILLGSKASFIVTVKLPALKGGASRKGICLFQITQGSGQFLHDKMPGYHDRCVLEVVSKPQIRLKSKTQADPPSPKKLWRDR